MSAGPAPRIDRGRGFARERGEEAAIEMSAPARLAAVLAALGLGVTALAGAPFFLWLLRRARTQSFW